MKEFNLAHGILMGLLFASPLLIEIIKGLI